MGTDDAASRGNETRRQDGTQLHLRCGTRPHNDLKPVRNGRQKRSPLTRYPRCGSVHEALRDYRRESIHGNPPNDPMKQRLSTLAAQSVVSTNKCTLNHCGPSHTSKARDTPHPRSFAVWSDLHSVRESSTVLDTSNTGAKEYLVSKWYPENVNFCVVYFHTEEEKRENFR